MADTPSTLPKVISASMNNVKRLVNNDRGYATYSQIGDRREHVYIEWRALCCPKAEYTYETTEDRFDAKAELGLFALADGVGSSYGAHAWAQAIVSAWTETPMSSEDTFEVEHWIRKLQPGFVMRPDAIARSHLMRRRLPDVARGAHYLAYACGLVKRGMRRSFRALCIGDSEMIHDPEGIFPIKVSSQFGSYPTVLRSKGFDRGQDLVLRYPLREKNRDPLQQAYTAKEPLAWLRPGEVLVLCTDALAHWALETDESHPKALRSNAIAQLLEQRKETWNDFVNDLRSKGRIVDDDTTALFIRISNDQKSPPTSSPTSDGWLRVDLRAEAIVQANAKWMRERTSELRDAFNQKPPSKIEIALMMVMEPTSPRRD